MIEKIKIENLTVFESLEIDTSAPVNVFIGENGTGKTQILKFIYMIFRVKETTHLYLGDHAVGGKLVFENFFTSHLENLTQMLYKKDKKSAHFRVTFNQKSNEYNIAKSEYVGGTLRDAIQYSDTFYEEITDNIIFIPAKDILTHSKGLPEISKKYKIDFDRTYIDIIEKSRMPELRELPIIAKNILPTLENIMNGKVEITNDKFYIKKRNGDRVSFEYEAEGIKKIGLLWQLLMNGTITEDTILLWDEFESNLNPKLTSDVADMLLELSRNGVQIFLSTHNYFLAKYFDVLEKDKKEVIFHSLYREDDNRDSPVICETSDTFSMLARNDIINEKIKLFEIEMEWE